MRMMLEPPRWTCFCTEMTIPYLIVTRIKSKSFGQRLILPSTLELGQAMDQGQSLCIVAA